MQQPIISFASRRLNKAVQAALVSLSIAAVLPAANAAEPNQAVSNQAQSARAYNIPAGPLSRNLSLFAGQAGILLSVDAALTDGKQSKGLQGKYGVNDGLMALLADTELEALPIPNGGYTLRKLTLKEIVNPKPVKAQEETLPEVTVNGEQDKHAIPEVYAGGQVATGGGVGLLGNLDVMDTPFNVTSYTSELIENQQARTVGDVIKNDPSVRSVRGPGDIAESYLIRGFQIFNAEFSVNGLYGVGPYGAIATESIERVELFKGPNALLNGMSPFGSVGGAVNVVTKKAGLDPLFKVTGTYSGDSVFGGQVDASKRFGPNNEFGVRINATHRDGATTVARQTDKSDVLAFGLDYKAEQLRLSADAGYQSKHRGSPISQIYIDGNFAIPKAPDLSKNYQQKWEYQESRDTYGMLKAEFEINKDWTSHASFGSAYGVYVDQRNILFLNNSAGDSNLLAPYNSYSYQKNNSAEIGVNGQFDTGFVNHKVSFSINSLYLQSGYSDGGQLGTAFATNIYQYVAQPEVTIEQMGISKQMKLGNKSILSSTAFADRLSILDDKVQLILGARDQRVRSDNYDTTTGNLTDGYDESKITPAVGFVVKPVRNISVYGNYIEGLSQGPSAPFGAANYPKTFAPTQSKQTELGVKFDFGSFATTFSAFQIEKPNGFVNASTNLFGLDGQQRNRGLEVNVFGAPSDHTRLLGGVAFSDNKLTKTDTATLDGKTAAGAPKVQLNLSGEWDVLALQGLTLSSRTTYSSQQYVDQQNTQEIPGYAVFDLGARYTFKAAGKAAIVRADLNNVFGKDYYSSGGNGLILGYPRTLFVSTSINF